MILRPNTIVATIIPIDTIDNVSLNFSSSHLYLIMCCLSVQNSPSGMVAGKGTSVIFASKQYGSISSCLSGGVSAPSGIGWHRGSFSCASQTCAACNMIRVEPSDAISHMLSDAILYGRA